MKVNSFFCGAGGFDLGFIQAGWEIAGAWDFDKYAIQSYQHNIGKHGQQADVTQMTGEDIPNANGWLFGFPCQDISVAGKSDKTGKTLKEKPRSGLFYQIMRLLGEVSDKPNWILAENVKNVKKLIPEIEAEYDKAGYYLVSPQLYNTKFWFLPQNRERYFLLGIRKDLVPDFVFPEQQTEFIPKLSSILEDEVDEKFYMSDEKAKVIIERAMEGLKVKQATKKGYDVATEGDTINISHPNSKTRRGRVGKQVAQTILTGQEQIVVEGFQTDKDGAAYCLDANYHKGLAPSSVGSGRRTQVIASRGRYISDGTTEQNYELRKDEVTNTITSVQKDNLVISEYRIRKLTPRECARLQGFPDSYEQVVSDTQFYKQMGNAVSVTVSHAIAKALKEWSEK
jgi:DNA (cytosine-5)-methyltransferase 1